MSKGFRTCARSKFERRAAQKPSTVAEIRQRCNILFVTSSSLSSSSYFCPQCLIKTGKKETHTRKAILPSATGCASLHYQKMAFRVLNVPLAPQYQVKLPNFCFVNTVYNEFTQSSVINYQYRTFDHVQGVYFHPDEKRAQKKLRYLQLQLHYAIKL